MSYGPDMGEVYDRVADSDISSQNIPLKGRTNFQDSAEFPATETMTYRIFRTIR
jgi:hypothetical protein